MSQGRGPPAIGAPERAIGAWLAGRSGAAPFAAMLREDGVLMVHQAELFPAWPLGPALELLLAVHELAGDQARRWSRARLYTSLDRPLDRAAVQVGGRRGRFGLPIDRGEPAAGSGAAPVLWAGPGAAAALARMRPEAVPGGAPLPLARALADRARRDGPLHGQDRAVGAVLVDPAGRAVLGATNQAREHRLLHAELVLLLSALRLAGGPLAPGHRVFSSLQPCRLCAALCVELGVAEVIFDEPEQGRFGQATALQRADRQRAATEAERRGEA